ncbi:MAG: hypothetical protein RLZZ628_3637 [Bacteroidota bacterium]|jgi:hypothetical protein
MSEYQFYQFKTVNRTLTKAEQKIVNTWSSRGNVSATTATFTYNYGDFKQNTEKCLLDYFDLFLYFADFGVRQMMFRFPKKGVDFDALKQYRYDDGNGRSIEIREQGDAVLIHLEESLDDGGFEGFVEYENTLGNIQSLWNDIMQGDYRSLYLIWLHFATLNLEAENDLDEDADEFELLEAKMPIVPAGFQQIDDSLNEFMAFWEISDDLIVSAARLSPAKAAPKTDFQAAIARLSDAEKSKYLLRFAQDEPFVQSEFLKHLKSLT